MVYAPRSAVALACLASALAGLTACGGDDSPAPDGGGDGGRVVDGGPAVDGGVDGGRVVDGGVDAGDRDGGGVAGVCEPLRLTYYTVGTAGACEVMDVPAALPRIARDGLTTAVAEPWFGGSLGGAPAEACGECWELTTAHGTRTVVVTDLCPIAGNPICAGDFFHFDVARPVAEALDFIGAGTVEASARRVPCPVEGSAFAVLRDGDPTFLRLAISNIVVGIRRVEMRGAGPGVSSDNPWQELLRDGGAYETPPGGASIARGGTGVQLRLTTAQGQTVESSVVIAPAGPFPRAVDLGVQVEDRAPPSGPACGWRVPDPYVDGFGGIESVRWGFTAWSERTIDDASTSGCVSGTCLAADLDAWGGLTLEYPEDFAQAGLTRLTLRARSDDAAPIEVKVGGPAGDCSVVSATLGAAYGTLTVDLAAACPAVPRLRTIQVQVVRGTPGTFTLDEVRLE